MRKVTRPKALIIGALTASIICISGSSIALAAQDYGENTTITPLGQVQLKEEGYTSSLVVVTETGAESVVVNRSDHTLSSVLTARGYDAKSFRDDKGLPLELNQRLSNGEQTVVYSSTVNGKSETIELKLPEQRVEDKDLYEGQTKVLDTGNVGKALKTTLIHRDLSKLSTGSGVTPESLDSAAISSATTQTGEEIYLTVIEPPRAQKVAVGTKVCGSKYLCALLDKDGLADLQISETYGHPLGKSGDWATYGGSPGHDRGAVDFARPSGTPIYSISDGVVVDAGVIGTGGNMVVIKHADSNLSAYAHMVETPLVKAGEKVKVGQLIGFVGSTGNSTGPHLHFEIWRDKMWGDVIPSYEYMKLHGVDLGNCSGGPCGLSKKD